MSDEDDDIGQSKENFKKEWGDYMSVYSWVEALNDDASIELTRYLVNAKGEPLCSYRVVATQEALDALFCDLPKIFEIEKEGRDLILDLWNKGFIPEFRKHEYDFRRYCSINITHKDEEYVAVMELGSNNKFAVVIALLGE